MKHFVRALIALAFVISPLLAGAADCQKTGSVCIDGPSTKNISGANIYKDCWKYQDTYQCVDTSGTEYYNYCTPLINAGCTVTSTTCAQTAFNGTCVKWASTYRCGNAVGGATGTVVLDNTYTIVSDTLDYSACTSIEQNQSCTLAETVCVEGPETRNIDGLDVYRDCWKYEQRYACAAGTYANYCAPLQTAGCVESTPATCLQTATYGSCILYERTYNCNSKLDPVPSDITYLNSSYTIISDQLNTSACTGMATNPNCTFSGQICVEGAGTRNINGLDVYKDCWKYEDTYVCASETLVSNCAELQARPECIETGTPTCVDQLPGGQCGLLEHTYECNIGGGTSKTITDCSNQKFCIGGKCFDSSFAPDNDFAKVISTMEVMREGGSYELFNGEKNQCERKLFGLANCCKSSSGGSSASNDKLVSTLGSTGLKAGAEYIRVIGSPYVYDALFETGIGALSEMAASGLMSYTGTGSVSVWGASFSFDAAGSLVVGFDPWSLAFSVVMHIVMDMMACDEKDQLTAVRKGQGLCHKVGSYCDKKTLGACRTKKETYCCFVSKLARIVNQQGRPQVGKGWGHPKLPDCSGFTPEQIASLRFDLMDFSEFFSSIQLPSAKSSAYAIDRLQQKAKSYYAP